MVLMFLICDVQLLNLGGVAHREIAADIRIKNLFRESCLACGSHGLLIRYICDYVCRMLFPHTVRRPFERKRKKEAEKYSPVLASLWFYDRRNNSIVISRGFWRTRIAARGGDFLRPGAILVRFFFPGIADAERRRKAGKEWARDFRDTVPRERRWTVGPSNN